MHAPRKNFLQFYPLGTFCLTIVLTLDPQCRVMVHRCSLRYETGSKGRTHEEQVRKGYAACPERCFSHPPERKQDQQREGGERTLGE